MMYRRDEQESEWDLDEYGQVSMMLSSAMFDQFGVGVQNSDKNHRDFPPERRGKKATFTT